jgi:hypothetical protein
VLHTVLACTDRDEEAGMKNNRDKASGEQDGNSMGTINRWK